MLWDCNSITEEGTYKEEKVDVISKTRKATSSDVVSSGLPVWKKDILKELWWLLLKEQQ